ncbi:MAG: (d)CMP kinase [Thermovirgaceae bacterium]
MISKKSKFFTITIDGPAGAGKSTVARRVAEKLGFEYLDTGALYRAVTLYLLKAHIPPADSPDLHAALREMSVRIDSDKVYVNDEEVSSQIRSVLVESNVSAYAMLPAVRNRLLKIQHEHAEMCNMVVDGRDMGTTVFPDANLKIYLVASLATRALRRWKDLAAAGVRTSVDEVQEQVQKRDRVDTNRRQSPLRVPSDAQIIDTSDMSITEVVRVILEKAAGIRSERGNDL